MGAAFYISATRRLRPVGVEAALTAWQGLFDLGGLEAGQRVLIHAAQAASTLRRAVRETRARGPFFAVRQGVAPT